MAYLGGMDPRILKFFGLFPTTEEESALQDYPGILESLKGAAPSDFGKDILKSMKDIHDRQTWQLMNPGKSLQRGYEALFPPSYSVNAAGERVDPRTGERLLPGGRVMTAPPQIQGPPAPPTPGGYMDPPTQAIKGSGFSRALPPRSKEEVSYDVHPALGEWAYGRMQELNSIGVDPQNILKIVRSEYYQKLTEISDQEDAATGAAMKVNAKGTISTPPAQIEKVAGITGSEMSPEEVSSLVGPTTDASVAPSPLQPTREVPTWAPRVPTDWAKMYEETATDLPKWSDMPQMTGLPEYQAPDYGGTLGEILRGLVYGAGMGAIGKDPVAADQAREKIARDLIERRRAEMRGDISAHREFFLKRAGDITNAKIKAIELRKGAEDKAVTDELSFYQTAMEADPTAINKLAPRIAQLRGIDPTSIQDLYDKETGKWRIARTPVEIEMEKAQAGIDFRSKMVEKYGADLGLKDPYEITKYKLTGQLEEESVEKVLSRRAVTELKSGNQAKYIEAMKDLRQYAIDKDETLMREAHRFEEGVRDLPRLKGKISDDVYNVLEANLFSSKWMGKMLPSMPRNVTGTLVGKMNPIYREAMDAIDDADKWAAFYVAHKMAPDAFMRMFNESNYKVGMPATAWEFGIDKLPYDTKSKSALLEELRYEQMEFAKTPKLGTPVRDQLVSDAAPYIRQMYGSLIRSREEALGRAMTDKEIGALYEEIQISGPPKSLQPKTKPKK